MNLPERVALSELESSPWFIAPTLPTPTLAIARGSHSSPQFTAPCRQTNDVFGSN